MVDANQVLVARSLDVVVGDRGAGCVALQRDGLVAGAAAKVFLVNVTLWMSCRAIVWAGAWQAK